MSGGLHSPASGLSEAMEVTEAKSIMYYIDDGVYGSFNCLLFDHAQVGGEPHTLTRILSPCR